MKGATPEATAVVSGFVAPGFEDVPTTFEHNFVARGEIGAAVAAYWRADKVVDLWAAGGHPTARHGGRTVRWPSCTPRRRASRRSRWRWRMARGWLDYDAPVARDWPAFAQAGKAAITVRQLLGHEAGLVWLDEPLTIDHLRDLDAAASILAREQPVWPPGTRHGYHAMTVGLYMQEILRRADPAHRTLGRFFQDEIARPLGLEFFIGLPPEVGDEHLATLKLFSTGRALRALPTMPWPMLLRKSLLVLGDAKATAEEPTEAASAGESE